MTEICPHCQNAVALHSETCPCCGQLMNHHYGQSGQDTLILREGNADPVMVSTEIELDELLLPGQVLNIYQCEKMLGRGGMGVVYLARNTSLQRLCALKLLSPRRIQTEIDYVTRFENEARAAAALVHPNVVTTHAIGRADDFHFLEMEYVAGNSLQHEIDSQGSIGPIRATSMAVGIASGLAMAHRLGIVHRDLKTDNVLVTPGGIPKIVDFGLAKRVVGADADGHALAGTPGFMAPELFEGQPATPATDVYALGVCYYLMLTGRYPFEGDSVSSLMRSILTENYISVRRINDAIPLDIAECVSLMLHREPAHRPRDGGAVSHLLQAVLGSVKDLDNLIYEAFDGLPSIRWKRDGNDRFLVYLTLPGERTQTVYVENSTHSAGDRLLLIFSVCCQAAPAYYEDALRLNAVVHHGGLSIRDIDGTPFFVMVDTYPRSTVSGEEIRRSVIELGCRADFVEERLTGKDLN